MKKRRKLTDLLTNAMRKAVDRQVLQFVRDLQKQQGPVSMADWFAWGHQYLDGLIAATGWDPEDIDALVEERLAILARRKILLALDVGTDTEYVINLQTED